LLPAQARNEALEAFAREVDANDLAEKVREIVSAIRERKVIELVERTAYLTDDLKRDLMNEFRNYTTPRVTLL